MLCSRHGGWTEQAYRAFQRQVDRVCTLILFGRPECEIENARIELRSEAKRLFPDKAQLYEIIYESRFRRLWSSLASKEAIHDDDAGTQRGGSFSNRRSDARRHAR